MWRGLKVVLVKIMIIGYCEEEGMCIVPQVALHLRLWHAAAGKGTTLRGTATALGHISCIGETQLHDGTHQAKVISWNCMTPPSFAISSHSTLVARMILRPFHTRPRDVCIPRRALSSSLSARRGKSDDLASGE